MKDISPITQPIFRRKPPGIQPDANTLGALLNSLPEAAVIVHRSQGVVYTANSAFYRLTAFSQLDIANEPVHLLLPELDLTHLTTGEENLMRLNRRQRESLPVLVQTRRLDETGLWVLLSIVPHDANRRDIDQFHAKVFASFTTLFRLSDLDTPEAVLEQVALVLQNLLETNLVCLYQAESDQPGLRKVAGDEAADFFPATLPSTDLMQPENDILWIPGRRVTSELQRAARVANLEYLVTLPLGSTEARIGLAAAGDRQKQPPEKMIQVLELFCAAVSGIFQHMLLSRHLAERVEQFEAYQLVRDTILANTETGVVILTPELNISEINQAAATVLEYSAGEVQGRPVDAILIGTDRLMPAVQRALHGKLTESLGQVTLHRRSGQPFPAVVQVTPAMQGNRARAVIVFLQDKTDFEYVRSKSEQLEQRALIGQFTAMFAHEVRNPLNNISTAMQVLAIRHENDPETQKTLTRMEDDTKRLTRLMDDLLSYAKPVESHIEVFDLVPLLKRIFERWRPKMTRKNIQGIFKAEDRPAMVEGDQHALDQVFTNLITNAIEAMEDAGDTLAIGVQEILSPERERQIEITVSDNGVGISEEVMDHLFTPFLTTKRQGTGLGLTITRRIVMAHKGDIKATSFPGGTVFRVLLPVAEGE
jgi:signal transduction histidine kinase